MRPDNVCDCMGILALAISPPTCRFVSRWVFFDKLRIRVGLCQMCRTVGPIRSTIFLICEGSAELFFDLYHFLSFLKRKLSTKSILVL